MLDYSNIRLEYKLNSYIENYNKISKLKSSNYLYSKKKHKLLGLFLIILSKKKKKNID